MPTREPDARPEKFEIDRGMLPANDLIFCDMFENAGLFKRIIRAVVGKNEKVDLKEPPLSQVAYKNPNLSQKIMDRLGSIRVDVQAEGFQKLFSLDLQQKYNETIILKRILFYSFRMYTSQTVGKLRYDRLKPACVTFIMTESHGDDKKHNIHRLTVVDETTGLKYFDVLDSYLVFVPNIIASDMNRMNDLYVFSSFFAIDKQDKADEFERNYGNKPLGKDLIHLYAQAVAKKSRLLDTRRYNYYFTEKEYERMKLEDEKTHAAALKKLDETTGLLNETTGLLNETTGLLNETTGLLNETTIKLNETKEQLKDTSDKLKDISEELLETKKKAREEKLESAVRLIHCGMDIAVVSSIINFPVADIENYLAAGDEQLLKNDDTNQRKKTE